MPSVIDNQDMDSISSSFVSIGNTAIKECLTEKLGPMKSELEARSEHDLDALLDQDLSNLIKIWKDIERSENGELNDASDLADLITGQIAGFNKEKLLEMCTLSKIAYGDVDRKLEKKGFKTKRQFEEAGYQIIKFYDNELIQDEYCSDTDYELEQHNVGYALTGSNSYNRDAGYVFIKDREVTIAYHGTRDLNDVREDLRAYLTKLSFLSGDNYAHSGFYSLFKRSWPSVHKILQGHANDQELTIKDLKINVTGHSMGGALASIAALCLNKTESAEDVHVATFGSPRVFNNNAAKVYSECLEKNTIRVACQSDPVPCLPHGNNGMHYKHVGKPLKLETDKTLEYLEPYYHKINTYYDLIQKVEQKDFKPDSKASKYRYIAYIFGLFYCAVLSSFSGNDREFFEKIKEENEDIKLSEISIEYAPKLEEKLKQGEQERDELNGKVTTLTKESSKLRKEFDAKSTQLTEKEKALDVAKGNVLQLQEKLKETQAQLKQEQESAKQELAEITGKFEGKEANLQNSKKELDDKNQALNAKIQILEGTKTQLEKDLVGAKQDLDKITKELKSKETNLEDSKKELDNVNKKGLKLEQEILNQQMNVGNLTAQVTQLTNEKNQLEEKLNSEVTTLTEKLENKSKELSQTLNVKTKALESTQAQLEKLQKELDAKTGEFKNTKAQLEQERDIAKQELAKITGEFESKEKALDAAKENVSQLQEKLKSTQAQLEREQESAKQELVEKTKLEEGLRQAEQNASTLNDKVDKLTEQNSQLKKQMDDAKQNLTNKTGKESQIQSLQKQLESKNKELNGKNEKFSGVSTHSKRQGNYASVSFLLSGALAVGASLAIPYLAICISLAVAALTFLTVGCYCFCKANTALSNVEVDNCVNPAVVEV